MASLVELEAPPQSSGDTSETAEEERVQGTRAPGTPLGVLFRGTSSLASVSEERAQPLEDNGSEAQSAEDRSSNRRASPPGESRPASSYVREDPDVHRDFFEDDQGNTVSVAQRVRERDSDRVAAAHERSLRLSIGGREEPTHRLSFQGPRGDTTKEFEDLWGPGVHASFMEAMIAFTRSDFGIGLIWQEWYANACAIRKLYPQDARAPKRGEGTMAFYASHRRRILKVLDVSSEESRLASLLYIEDGEVNPAAPVTVSLRPGPPSGMGEIRRDVMIEEVRREVVSDALCAAEQRSSGAAHAGSTNAEERTSTGCEGAETV